MRGGVSVKMLWRFLYISSFSVLLFLVACGGGGGGEGSTTTAPITHPILVILTTNLPIGVQGLPYSGTLTASHGVAPYTWSVDSNTPLPSGLTLDPASGTLSGTPTSGGANVTFQVTDSSNPPQIAKTQLLVGINIPLSLQIFQNVQVQEYQGIFQTFALGDGGLFPLTFSVVQGALPAGVKLNPTTGMLTGTPLASGSYNVVIAVKDSYNPPEVVTQPGTVVVAGAPLTAGTNMNGAALILNRPYSGGFVASGGTPPYTFQLYSGALPPGLSITDPANGIVSGTPIRGGSYSFELLVSDSASMSTYVPVYVSVSNGLGRNDSPAQATPIGNNLTQGSISPAVDSSGNFIPDTDYYKLIAAAGSTVHVETTAKRNNALSPLDTVIELTDVNGARLSTGCNQPGGTTTDFSSPCLNDDISASPHIQDSSLDYKVPGNSGNQSFLVHVLDWSGMARPDMVYNLQVSGVLEPLKFTSIAMPTGTLGIGYLGQIFMSGGAGTITFSVVSGSLPPGLTLSSGNITGTPTSTGHYEFAIQATDQSSPPQQLTKSYVIDVANPLVVTSTNPPDAFVGSPYTFQLTSTGGFGPIQWTAYFLPPGLSLSSTGVISGTPTQSGNFSSQINASDAGGYMFPQNVIASISIVVH